MKIKYYAVPKANLHIVAPDATYDVQFAKQCAVGRTWEFDPNSDAIGQDKTVWLGRILVVFTPDKNTMAFKEDANRQLKYVIEGIDDARILWKFLKKNNPHFWFALDVASEGEDGGRGIDSFEFELEHCAGCATSLERSQGVY